MLIHELSDFSILSDTIQGLKSAQICFLHLFYEKVDRAGCLLLQQVPISDNRRNSKINGMRSSLKEEFKPENLDFGLFEHCLLHITTAYRLYFNNGTVMWVNIFLLFYPKTIFFVHPFLKVQTRSPDLSWCPSKYQ